MINLTLISLKTVFFPTNGRPPLRKCIGHKIKKMEDLIKHDEIFLFMWQEQSHVPRKFFSGGAHSRKLMYVIKTEGIKNWPV